MGNRLSQNRNAARAIVDSASMMTHPHFELSVCFHSTRKRMRRSIRKHMLLGFLSHPIAYVNVGVPKAEIVSGSVSLSPFWADFEMQGKSIRKRMPLTSNHVVCGFSLSSLCSVHTDEFHRFDFSCSSNSAPSRPCTSAHQARSLQLNCNMEGVAR